MTALEALYNKFLADEKKTYDDFHDAFRDCCPQIFFKGISGLCVHGGDTKDICCRCWLQEVYIYHMIDEIFLLSADEYKKYADIIPIVETFWWLRGAGWHDDEAILVRRGGTIDDIGGYVNATFRGVRPALTIEDCVFANLRIGERYVKYDFPWIKIDNNLAIAEVPIGFNKFDSESNDYEKSEVRQYLLNWLKSRKELIK